MNKKSTLSILTCVAFSLLAALEVLLLFRFLKGFSFRIVIIPTLTMFTYLMLISGFILLAISSIRDKPSYFIIGCYLAAGAYFAQFVSAFRTLFGVMESLRFLYALNFLSSSAELALFILLLILAVSRKEKKGLLLPALIVSACASFLAFLFSVFFYTGVSFTEFFEELFKILGFYLRAIPKLWRLFIPDLVLFAAILFMFLESRRKTAPAAAQSFTSAYVPEESTVDSAASLAPASEAQKYVFCPECGTKMPSGAMFCTRCGSRMG